MGISQDEARESLSQVADAAERTRKLVAYGSVDRHLIVWGAIWALGFCSNQFLPVFCGYIWLGLVVAGLAASAVIGMGEPLRRTVGKGFGLFWVFLYAYVCLWIWLLSPFITVQGPEQSAAFGRHIAAIAATVPMLGYVFMGLWLGRFMLWVGLAVTVVAILGLLALPDYFYLWMAALGGGTLAGTGLFIRNRWR